MSPTSVRGRSRVDSAEKRERAGCERVPGADGVETAGRSGRCWLLSIHEQLPPTTVGAACLWQLELQGFVVRIQQHQQRLVRNATSFDLALVDGLASQTHAHRADLRVRPVLIDDP